MKSARTFCLAMLAPLALLSLPGATATNFPASEAFEQCLRDAMKGVTSDRAADEVTRACGQQARGSRARETDLPPEALAKMVVHAGFGWEFSAAPYIMAIAIMPLHKLRFFLLP